MRIALPCLVILSACSSDANHIGNPLLVPFNGLATLAENVAYDARRGPVEVFVKSNHPALVSEIDAGGGSLLDNAMDLARIPTNDRPTRLIQLNSDLGLYAANPGAMVTALMVFGDQ